VGEDIFCRHHEFLNRGGKAPLEQNWLVDLAQRLQQVEVLHIAAAHL